MEKKNIYSAESEDRFLLLCTKSGVTCTKSARDENAWDFYIEIPPNEQDNSLPDKRLGMKDALVQVKSSTSVGPQTKLKVSNAIKLAQRQMPCFIVLFHYCDKESPRIYVIHVWEEMITRALKRARILALKSKKLHKHTIQITFQEEDERTENLISWISNLVRNFPNDYISKKQFLFQNIGYEGKNYAAALSLILPRGYEDLVDMQLGLIDELKTSRVRILDHRFNLKNPKPLKEFNSGSLKLKPSVLLKAIVTMQIKDDRLVRLNGEIRIPYVPNMPDEYFRIAIHTTVCSLIISRTNLQFKYQVEKNLHASDLGKLAQIMSWGGESVRVCVRSDLFPDLDDVFSFPTLGTEEHMRQLSKLCEGLSIISDFVQSNVECYSLGDIDRAYDNLYAFRVLNSTGSLRVMGTPLDSKEDSRIEDGYSSCTGYLTFSIGDCYLFVIYKIQIENFVIEQGNVSMVWNDRKIEDAFTGKNEETTFMKGNDKYKELLKTSLNDCLNFGSLNFLDSIVKCARGTDTI